MNSPLCFWSHGFRAYHRGWVCCKLSVTGPGRWGQECKTNLDYIVMEDASQQESSMHLKRQKELLMCGQKPKVVLWKGLVQRARVRVCVCACVYIYTHTYFTALMSQVINGWPLSSVPTKRNFCHRHVYRNKLQE